MYGLIQISIPVIDSSLRSEEWKPQIQLQLFFATDSASLRAPTRLVIEDWRIHLESPQQP